MTIYLPDMIRGFQEGVAGMQEGEKRRLYIHPDLAYGVSNEVPPNSILFFDVEVVNAGKRVPNQIKNTAQQEAPQMQQANPKPLVLSDPVDEWDLPLDDNYEEDDFQTQPFQLKSVQRNAR